MDQKKKIEKVLNLALSEDLTEFKPLLKAMKKRLPLFGRTERIALALIKEYVGDISRLDFSEDFSKPKVRNLVFEDVQDGRVRLFINLGKNHRINPGDLIREIVKRSGVDGKQIGKIDIHSTYSFIQVPEQYAEIIIFSFDGARVRGVNVVLEPAKRKKEREPEIIEE
ncbi:MAG: DbpA RNA binding domain-containing protein [Spirochaetota bacterium]